MYVYMYTYYISGDDSVENGGWSNQQHQPSE